MKHGELTMVALKVYPQLKDQGFFTSYKGVDYYFAGLKKMNVETIYRSFYDEYDVAFSMKCIFSICDYKADTKWIRMEGCHHEYRTPVLFIVNRFDCNYSPAQITHRMRTSYRANTLIVDEYTHPGYSFENVTRRLEQDGIHFILRKELNTGGDIPVKSNTEEKKKLNQTEKSHHPSEIVKEIFSLQQQ